MAGSRAARKKVTYLLDGTFWQTVRLMRATASASDGSVQCARTAARSTVISSAAPVPLPETSPRAMQQPAALEAKS